MISLRTDAMCNLSELIIEETIEETKEEIIQFFIDDYLEDGKSRELIIQKIMKCFNLNEENATYYFEKFKV